MEIQKFPAGPLDTNGYLLTNENQNLAIDPSLNPNGLIEAIRASGNGLIAILLTHAHFDHYLGLDALLEAFGDVPVYGHPETKHLLGNPGWSGADMMGISEGYTGEVLPLEEGKFVLGAFELDIFFVPGHSPGHVAIYDGANLFTGDTLFAGSIGRADWGYSDPQLLLKNIAEKLMTLPDDTVIWPGHANRSTIGREKRMNPYLQGLV